jgi:hypothetical protein
MGQLSELALDVRNRGIERQGRLQVLFLRRFAWLLYIKPLFATNNLHFMLWQPVNSRTAAATASSSWP